MPPALSADLNPVRLSSPALVSYGRPGSAVSAEAVAVASAVKGVMRSVERSQALSGARTAALSRLGELVNDCAAPGWDGEDALPLSPLAYRNARDLIRAWPAHLPLPEFAPEPDGSISLDWIESRHRLFSISVSESDRLAFAWLDGTDRGHGVARFDGVSVPERILSGARSIINAYPAVRAA